MIACVCPGSSSADHTLNTLRYSDRLKDRSNDPKHPKLEEIIYSDENLTPKSDLSEKPIIVAENEKKNEPKLINDINLKQKFNKPSISNDEKEKVNFIKKNDNQTKNKKDENFNAGNIQLNKVNEQKKM